MFCRSASGVGGLCCVSGGVSGLLRAARVVNEGAVRGNEVWSSSWTPSRRCWLARSAAERLHAPAVARFYRKRVRRQSVTFYGPLLPLLPSAFCCAGNSQQLDFILFRRGISQRRSGGVAATLHSCGRALSVFRSGLHPVLLFFNSAHLNAHGSKRCVRTNWF